MIPVGKGMSMTEAGSPEDGLRVYLAGPPYSGKTATGIRAGELMGLPSLDLDAVIEEAEDMTVPEIFHICGEYRFRELERFHLERLANSGERFILSLGGGSLLDDENLRTVISTGILITLLVPLRTLLERASSSRGERPLAHSTEELRMLLDSRESHYTDLPNGIHIGGMTVDEASQAVLAVTADIREFSNFMKGKLQTRE